jgi:hypothetical protein
MKTEPKPPDWEVLAGMVERVTYQNAENGLCVVRVKARGHRELVTVVGHAAVISVGEWITATGEWLNDRTYRQQGNVDQCDIAEQKSKLSRTILLRLFHWFASYSRPCRPCQPRRVQFPIGSPK